MIILQAILGIINNLELMCALVALILSVVAFIDSKKAMSEIRKNREVSTKLLNDRHQEVRDLNFALRKEFIEHVDRYTVRHDELRTIIADTQQLVMKNINNTNDIKGKLGPSNNDLSIEKVIKINNYSKRGGK